MTKYPDPKKIPTTADKLRYYRYKNALLQKDVAAYAGIEHGTYITYESGKRRQYAPNELTAFAELFGVTMDDLLDDYNRFMLNQGENFRRITKLMEWLEKTDFYTAPASTKYHLATAGGLL